MRIIKHFKKNKFNTIFLLGLLLEVQLFITFFIIFVYQGLDNNLFKEVQAKPEAFSFSSNLHTWLFILLFLPLIEEVVHRWHVGVAHKKKRTKIVITIFSLLAILILFQSATKIEFFFLSLLGISYSLNFFNKTFSTLKISLAQIILTSVSFSFFHYGPLRLFDTPDIASISLTLNFIGVSFILCYLRINYGLFWAFLFHFVFNAILFSYQFSASEINETPITHTTSCYTLSVAESGVLDNLADFEISQKHLQWKTLHLNTGFHKALQFNKMDLDFFANQKNIQLDSVLDLYSQKKQFKVYSLNIQKKDSCLIELEEILRLLEKEGLMVKQKQLDAMRNK